MKRWIFALFVVIPLMAVNCDGSKESKQTIKRERLEPKFREDGKLWFMREKGGDTIREIRIEVVEKQIDIQYGMMYRKSMEDDTGMLFLMKQERPQSFYMKNTYVSLDIIYINSDKQIVSIAEKTEPMSEKSLPSGAPALYVLEVPGGYCQKHGITRFHYVDFLF
ncbi:MAG: DUF192 domain-containing protein [Cryomorphaceae bacterium]|nr:DUF192 domain-containing protein [Cryomorphaceae bacterium]